MRRLNLPIAVLAALIIPISGLVAAAPAAAYNVSAVYRDCENNGQLTGHYSKAELQAALNHLPAQVSEYSACADVIRQALVRASSHGHTANSKGTITGGGGGGHNGGGGSGKTGTGHRTGTGGVDGTRSGGTPGTSSSSGPGVATLAGSGVRPGSSSGGSSSLPMPLLVVLILLALTAVSGGAVAIRRRVVARGST